MRRSPVIYAVGGGKGGIGKSLIAANLAFRFANSQKKVVAIDLDIGSANLHTCLGMSIPLTGLNEYFIDEKPLEFLAAEAPHQNLSLISGQRSSWDQYQVKSHQIKKFISDCRQLNADIIVFDLGAGTHPLTLDFFLAADQGVIVVIPEPTSIENSYVFLKGLFMRIMTSFGDLGDQKKIQDYLKQSSSPEQIVHYIFSKHPKEGREFLERVKKLHTNIIINQVRKKADLKLGESMSEVVKSYFRFQSKFIGGVSYDDQVWLAARKKKVFLSLYPHSLVARDIEQIARHCFS
jgi:flagellar biosynthesis protein FlhG